MLPHSDTLSLFRANPSLFFLLSGEAANTNFIVLGLTRLGLEPRIYHIPGKHTNHNTTDAVGYILKFTNIEVAIEDDASLISDLKHCFMFKYL
jgi:hypothetical protein